MLATDSARMPGGVRLDPRMEVPPTNLGSQPLDQLMERWKLDAHDLVEVSTEQLNHKQVQKGRSGKRLTLHSMQKVTRAFNVAIWQRLDAPSKEAFEEYKHRQLFNYAKGYDAQATDPNEALMP
jgi:hypothetical protein